MYPRVYVPRRSSLLHRNAGRDTGAGFVKRCLVTADCSSDSVCDAVIEAWRKVVMLDERNKAQCHASVCWLRWLRWLRWLHSKVLPAETAQTSASKFGSPI
jgi:hypothetical protein